MLARGPFRIDQASGLRHLAIAVIIYKSISRVFEDFSEIQHTMDDNLRSAKIPSISTAETSLHLFTPSTNFKTTRRGSTSGTAYCVSFNSLSTSSGFSRFALRIVGGVALVSPCPTTMHPARLKALRTCRPRRPVAPVTRTVCDILSAR